MITFLSFLQKFKLKFLQKMTFWHFTYLKAPCIRHSLSFYAHKKGYPAHLHFFLFLKHI
ncbi:Hypothetical protein BN2458_PEG0142 [Helicobacter typhlonius]|uniref:Uncharacterized protein n=1 Tax=Helicobacter typhlonius TaxID=76936 RepID=A0A0S4PS30_9HELI|nr:Hypothetical protein BN2458_PEG0142 [Helicobacter typhlonius]